MTACGPERLAVDSTGSQGKIYLLKGYAPAEPAPAAAFAAITRTEIADSLRRQKVRVSKYISFMRGDPEPFFTNARVEWLGTELHKLLPAMLPGERVELHFNDRFHGYEIQVQIYPQGRQLVYRYLRLAAMPEHMAPERKNDSRPLNYVALEPQVGQTLHEEKTAFVLMDPVFLEAGGNTPAMAAKVQVVRDAKEAGELTLEEANAIEAVVLARPTMSMDTLKNYLKRSKTLAQAVDEGLLTDEEYKTKQDALNREFGL